MKPAVARALAFVEAHGVVLASARGPAARLVEAIAGEAIAGNWWTHPRASAIYNVLAEVCDSDQLLVCRVVGGKVTLVHRRLWPALVRLADRLPAERVCQVRDEHTPSGRHVRHEVPFPDWVPAEVAEQARALDDRDASAQLAPWIVLPAR